MKRASTIVSVLMLLTAAVALAFPGGVALGAPSRQTPPSGLSATAVSASQINLSWTDNTTTETGFEIERQVDGGGWASLTTVGANATSHSDTTVSCGHTYDYRVRALTPLGNSNWSNIATAATPTCPGGTTPSGGTTAPPAPAAPATPIPRGALIKLRVHPNAVPVNWTELWTVVEWQDGDGGWNPIEDWQGMVDTVEDGLGLKSWWVAPEDILSGPYRWVVYDRNGGELLGVSDPFNTPDFWQEVVVDVGLDAVIAAQRAGTQVPVDDESGSLPGTGFATPIVYVGALGLVLAVAAVSVAGVRGYLKRQEAKKKPRKE